MTKVMKDWNQIIPDPTDSRRTETRLSFEEIQPHVFAYNKLNIGGVLFIYLPSTGKLFNA